MPKVTELVSGRDEFQTQIPLIPGSFITNAQCCAKDHNTTGAHEGQNAGDW